MTLPVSMWQTAVVAATVALCSSLVLGQVAEDVEEVRLQRELYKLEHEGHHRHHGHRRFLGLMGHPNVQKQADNPLLPGRHPAVTRKLANMDQAMHGLIDRRSIAEQSRFDLEGEVNKATVHLNSIVAIKSQLAKTEIRIRTEERKLQQLEDDRLRLDKTHHSLTSSLQHIMGSKVAYAKARLQKKQHQLEELKARDAEWKEKTGKFHAASLAMLEERRKSKESLEASLVDEERAHQARMTAEKKFRLAKKDTTFNIEGYRFSETEEKAADSKEKRGQRETDQAKVAVKRLNHILTVQQQRVDESMAIGKDRVNGKMRQIETAKKHSTAKLTELRNEYAQWQAQQQAWAAEVAAKQQKTQLASKDLSDDQEAILTNARDQVTLDAEDDSDWAWGGESAWPGN